MRRPRVEGRLCPKWTSDWAKSAKNRKTLLREAEEAAGKYADINVDCLFVMEETMRHFYFRAMAAKRANGGKRNEQIDEDFRQAAQFASMAAPHWHARLATMTLARDFE